MNLNNLQQIFSHYTESFEKINNAVNNENYKWQVVKRFQKLMGEALEKEGKDFAEALYKAKASTANIIDSYTQPFHGLVEFARKEPDIVKKMFQDLYSDDGGILQNQEMLIADFFRQSNQLLEKYSPGSYRFKQNSHSVSAYLFLHDPDNHYMFKATQAAIFADCIEFFDDWGTGDNIKLDVFYRMCDMLVGAIKENEGLLKTDESRFSEKFTYKLDEMFQDKEKHLLAFDIIYCCSTYDLFDGISFTRPKTKEKQLFIERKKKAEQLLLDYNHAREEQEQLNMALDYFRKIMTENTLVKHKLHGEATVERCDSKYILLHFRNNDERKKISMPIGIANKIITCDVSGFREKANQYGDILKRADSIAHAVKRTENALKPYEEYLE